MNFLIYAPQRSQSQNQDSATHHLRQRDNSVKQCFLAVPNIIFFAGSRRSLRWSLARDGCLWVGTYNGLARFDGVRFTSTASITSRRTPLTNGRPGGAACMNSHRCCSRNNDVIHGSSADF